MLEKVRARAERKGLAARIRLHQCPADSLGLGEKRADFALAFWMVHEVLDAARFLGEARGIFRDGVSAGFWPTRSPRS
jgi:ubiquinone/menaquinone biosynthesis C-methylase UbiE